MTGLVEHFVILLSISIQLYVRAPYVGVAAKKTREQSSKASRECATTMKKKKNPTSSQGVILYPQKHRHGTYLKHHERSAIT